MIARNARPIQLVAHPNYKHKHKYDRPPTRFKTRMNIASENRTFMSLQ